MNAEKNNYELKVTEQTVWRCISIPNDWFLPLLIRFIHCGDTLHLLCLCYTVVLQLKIVQNQWDMTFNALYSKKKDYFLATEV